MKEIYINADDYNSDSIRTIQGNNNSEEYKIYLQYDNEKIDLTGKTVNLGFLRVGSTEGDIIENLNVTNPKEGEITLKITNKISKRNGTYSCQLAILGEGDFLEHTATFTLTVENNIFSDITKAIADSKDFTYLENILDKASKLNEKLKENTSSATNANSNLESNITEANNINSKLLENTSTATSLNKNLESNINLAKEVKETIKDLDTKNIEATEKIETLTGLNSKAIELSNNINQALPLNSELIKNTESAKTANNELIATNNDAKAKKTDLDNSLEEAKKYISGLDGSQNIPQLRLDVDALQNGLKSNQALEYKGSSINAENTLEGRTEGMRIGGRTLVNISPKGISDCSSISAFNHNYQEVKVEQGDGFVKCTQPLAKKYNILGYDNVNMLKTNTYYLHMAYVEILNNPSNDTCEFQLGNFDIFKTIKISQGKGIVAALTKTHSNLSGGNSKWISLMLGTLNSTGENRSFKVFNIATYEISEKEASLEIESLIKLYPIKCNGMKSFGESEREGDKYKISILSHGKNLFDINNIEIKTDSIIKNKNGYILKNYSNNTNKKVKEVFPFLTVGKTYAFSFEFDYKGNSPVGASGTISFYDFTTSSLIKSMHSGDKITVTNDILETYVFLYGVTSGETYISNIQVEEGSKTIYEHYKSYKKDILIKEPLKEREYIYEDNGQVKVCRKSYEYTLNGENEDWIVWTNSTGDTVNAYVYFNRMTPNLSGIVKPNSSNTNDRLPANQGGYLSTKEGFKITSEYFAISIHKSKLGVTDVNDPNNSTLIKKWLKENPITMICQLATPTVEIVENCVDIDLDTFQGKTYFSIENSSPGTLDFKVPSNIGSVVQNMAKEVNNIWDVINNLLVPGILKANGNLAMIKLNNNLK
ncbi:BppU family phage baseplate upper protein [Clostridium perfringens]